MKTTRRAWRKRFAPGSGHRLQRTYSPWYARTQARATVVCPAHGSHAVRVAQLNEHLAFAMQGTITLKRRLLCKVMELLVRGLRGCFCGCVCSRRFVQIRYEIRITAELKQRWRTSPDTLTVDFPCAVRVVAILSTWAMSSRLGWQLVNDAGTCLDHLKKIESHFAEVRLRACKHLGRRFHARVVPVWRVSPAARRSRPLNTRRTRMTKARPRRRGRRRPTSLASHLICAEPRTNC